MGRTKTDRAGSKCWIKHLSSEPCGVTSVVTFPIAACFTPAQQNLPGITVNKEEDTFEIFTPNRTRITGETDGRKSGDKR